MSSEFQTLTEANTNAPVVINASQVLFVRPSTGSSPPICVVHFSDTVSVPVFGDVTTVTEKLKGRA